MRRIVLLATLVIASVISGKAQTACIEIDFGNGPCVPATVEFINCSSGAVGETWELNLPTGVVTINGPATYTFNTPGVYLATLYVMFASGAMDTAMQTFVITSAPTIVSHTPSVTAGCAPLDVCFTQSVTGGTAPYAFLWDFCDSTWSNLSMPCHTYTQPGCYCYTLTVQDINGCVATATVAATDPNAVCVTSPQACFTSTNPLACSPPHSVSFSSCSTPASGLTYLWSFPGGMPATFSGATPAQVVYSVVGMFNVSLTVVDAAGCSNTVTMQNYVNIGSTGVTCFAMSNDTICAGGAVLLQACPAQSYQWTSTGGTFTNPTGANTALSFATPGTYYFCLTATDQGCTAQLCSTVVVVAGNCLAPSGAAATNVTGSSATVSWAGSDCAVKYRVRVKNMVTGVTNLYIVNAPVASLSLSNLPSGTLYKVRVRSQCSANGAVLSSWSAPTYFTTTGSTASPCVPPQNVMATSTSNTAAVVSWDPVSGATGYGVRYRVAGTTAWTPVVVNGGSNTSAALTGLQPNSAYEFQVRTRCQQAPVVWSAFSPVAFFVTPLRLDPPATAAVLYPNPALHYTVLFFLNKPPAAARVILTAPDGRVVLEMESILFNQSTLPIDLTQLAAGFYLVHITTDESTFTEKLFIQR